MATLAIVAGTWCALVSGTNRAQSLPPRLPDTEKRLDSAELRRFVNEHCIACHNRDNKKGNLALDAGEIDSVAAHGSVWEKVIRKLTTRQMPPPGRVRPKEATYGAIVAALESELDRAAAIRPCPGRTPTLRRLNRVEYQNAVRDLLAVEVDAATLLPADEANHGFYSAPLGELTPTLVERYVAAAQKIARLAVGRPPTAPLSETFRVPPDRTQEGHVEGLPLGTRGGLRIPYTFPQDGHYDIQAWLTRDRNEQVEGLREPHEMVFLVDRRKVATLTVRPPVNNEVGGRVDANLKARLSVTAGPHDLGVTFLQYPFSLLETRRQPYAAHYNLHRHPRISPAIFQVTITGPYEGTGRGDTPSRRRIFCSTPNGPADEEACARRILAELLRRAYRRPVNDDDIERSLRLYRRGRMAGDFDAGIEMAISGMLVNPQFLFRIERDPPDIAEKTAYPIADLDLASRLSFFLWSSIPDDELLDLAARGELGRSDVYEKQVRRLLADRRSSSLSTDFASQWLHLLNLDGITPDLRSFPDFDDNLRQAFRRETESLFETVVREDRSVLDLLRVDFTFLNERLARHYGIPHVYGERFRKISLGPDRERGGLLRHGSVLTVTSYATRTSPVLRGKWILENLVGTPPPPPPANVPSLSDNMVSASLPIRERLSEHRNSVACAGCHRLIDPLGFALEQFDAVGRWRAMEEGKPVDAEGGMPDGSTFVGVAGLEKALLARPEPFLRTLAEKLFTFALGRAPEATDAPAIRRIVRQARSQEDRFSALILALVTSEPFRMRETP